MIRGPDVSSVQGKVPWDKLAAIPNVRFGIAKCIQGNDGKDSQFANNIQGMRDNGLIPGAYHFAYPLPHLDPRAQAQLFFKGSSLGSGKEELPPMIDLEWPPPEQFGKWSVSDSQVCNWVLACLDECKSLFGRVPTIYTYPYFAAAIHIGAHAELIQYPLVLAKYDYTGVLPPEGYNPTPIPPWNKVTICQHDGNKGLTLPNGIDCDWNVFTGGDETAWLELINAPVVSHETC